MEANYLLKNGLMTEKDYALIVQQQKSGYSALNNLAKNADAKYKEAMTRLAADCAKGPCSSAIEEWNNNTLLGFGNLKNTIGDANYNISILREDDINKARMADININEGK